MEDRIKTVPSTNDKSPGSPPKQSKENLNVKVDITGMDIFKSIVSIMEFLFANANENIRLEAIKMMEEGGILNLYKKESR